LSGALRPLLKPQGNSQEIKRFLTVPDVFSAWRLKALEVESERRIDP
jgi:hypothetical protein